MLREREIKVNIFRDQSQTNLCRTGGKIRRPKSVQHRLYPTNSSTRLSVVVVPIKVEWKQDETVQQQQHGVANLSLGNSHWYKGFSGNEGAENSGSSNENVHETPVVPSGTTKDLGQFRMEGLNCHNAIREKHGAPLLSLDEGLCQSAQQWADRLAATNRFDHKPNNDYGENLYSQWATSANADCSAQRAVESWYDECKGYSYSSEPLSLGYGHFTQLVWRSTKRIGMGKAKTRDGKRTIIVANYDPPGNYVGQYVQNVQSPKM